MFIDPAPWGEPFRAEIKTPKGIKYVWRRFIPAKLKDNPYLTQTDDYLIMLASLPPVQRAQWLEGNWDIFENAAFPEFQREKHISKSFEIPSNWIKFRACDYGYSSNACCLWFAVDYDGILWVYRELYTKRVNAEEFARKVLELEKNENIYYGVLDASVWAKRGDVGPDIAETMMRQGCKWRPSDKSKGSRISGKLELHRRLAIDEEMGEPRIKIFENCKNLLRTLPELPLDENNCEDVDTKAEDHAYDALRYGCMSRPVSPSSYATTFVSAARQRYAPADPIFGY